MASNTGKIIAKIRFDKSINKEVSASIESQLRTAQNKWKINLTDDEKSLIRKYALIQLCEKMSDVFKQPFPENAYLSSVVDADDIVIAGYEDYQKTDERMADALAGGSVGSAFDGSSADSSSDAPDKNTVSLDFSEVSVLIRSKFHDREVRMILDVADDKDYNILLTRTSAGYIVAEEETDKSTWLGELPDVVHTYIHKWVQTAVFYGVGSLS